MPELVPPKVRRYSLEFKLKAVRLSELKGVEVRAVAEAHRSADNLSGRRHDDDQS